MLGSTLSGIAFAYDYAKPGHVHQSDDPMNI